MSPPTGVLRLRAVPLGGRTVLAETYRSAPFHLTAASYRRGNGTAEVIVQQVSPGLLPGDHVLTEIDVKSGARLVVRGQSATKVYPAPNGGEAQARTVLRVAADAALTYLPGELIPFRDAVYRQETEVDLCPGARLALGETLTPGRVAMGERDAYSVLDLRLCLRLNGRPLLIERARLEPAVRPLRVVGRHGSHGCAGSLYLFGVPQGVLDDEGGAAGLWWGHGFVDGLTVVRVLGETAQTVNAQVVRLIARAFSTAD